MRWRVVGWFCLVALGGLIGRASFEAWPEATVGTLAAMIVGANLYLLDLEDRDRGSS